MGEGHDGGRPHLRSPDSWELCDSEECEHEGRGRVARRSVPIALAALCIAFVLTRVFIAHDASDGLLLGLFVAAIAVMALIAFGYDPSSGRNKQ